jgi:8-oxo-dGTP diphosphatase
MALIRAAGGLVWRAGPDGPRVAVIHRRRREDWSLPKGKLEEGESWTEAAVREVREETGCLVRLREWAGSTWYVPRKTPKVVSFWNMELVRQGPLETTDEVDEVVWLAPHAALARLDHGNERAVLRRALTRAAVERSAAGQAVDPRAPARGLERTRAALSATRGQALRQALGPEVDGQAVGRLLAGLDRADRWLDEGDEARARALLDRAGRALQLLARTG